MRPAIPPLCVICQREIVGFTPAPWRGANAHKPCVADVGDLDDGAYGEAVGRAVASLHEPGTCGIEGCVCLGRLK